MNFFASLKTKEKLMQGVFVICAFFSIFALGVITVFLFANGLPFMVEIGVSFCSAPFGTRQEMCRNTEYCP